MIWGERLVWLTGLIALAGYAQWQRWVGDELARMVITAHEWVDEIIEALEEKDEEVGDERVGSLVAQRRDM